MNGKEKSRLISPGALAGLVAAAGGIVLTATFWLWRSRSDRSTGSAPRIDDFDDSASLPALIADAGMIPDVEPEISISSESLKKRGEQIAGLSAPPAPHFPEELEIPGKP